MLGLAMLIGRFLPIVLSLALAGSLAGARVHARTRATLDTSGPTFMAFLIGVIVIVGGLIYFPMLILGPHRRTLYRLAERGWRWRWRWSGGIHAPLARDNAEH
jgi:K+-transporting ATPase A subunit